MPVKKECLPQGLRAGLPDSVAVKLADVEICALKKETHKFASVD